MRIMLSCALLSLSLAVPTMGGPLTPPAGPVTSSLKTLSDVEPRTIINATNTPGDGFWAYKITQPGSYYLAAPISGAIVAGKGGILVGADNVVIDLNGYAITGNNTNSRDGIGSPSLFRGTQVLNGTIDNFAGDGVSLGERARLVNVRVTSCGQNGIEALAGSTAIDCSVTTIGLYGYKLWGEGTFAERCTASGCSIGFNGPNRTVHCAARECSTAGFYVYVAAEGCEADANTGIGFQTSNGSVVTNCTAANNISAGLSIGNDARAFNCSSISNGTSGFEVHASAVVDHCSAGDNAVFAVRVSGFHARINDCTLSGVAAFPVVSIDASIPDVEIARNHISGGTYAIAGTGAVDAIIVANHCVNQSTGFSSVPVASNQVGPVVSVNGTIASTSPWANFVR